MNSATVPGRAVRQSTRILLQVPGGQGYAYFRDILDLVAGDLLDNIEVLGRFGEDAGRVRLSYDRNLLFVRIGASSAPRFYLTVDEARNLIAGRITWVRLRPLNSAGDPTRPVHYYHAPFPTAAPPGARS